MGAPSSLNSADKLPTGVDSNTSLRFRGNRENRLHVCRTMNRLYISIIRLVFFFVFGSYLHLYLP